MKELPRLSQRAYESLLEIYGHVWYQTAHEAEAAPMDRLEDLLAELAEKRRDWNSSSPVMLGMCALDWVCEPGAIRRLKEERAKKERREQRKRERQAA